MQFEEYSDGLILFSWYIILHTTITQAQTEDTLKAKGRSLGYGRANVQNTKNKKFISDT